MPMNNGKQTQLTRCIDTLIVMDILGEFKMIHIAFRVNIIHVGALAAYTARAPAGIILTCDPALQGSKLLPVVLYSVIRHRVCFEFHVVCFE